VLGHCSPRPRPRPQATAAYREALEGGKVNKEYATISGVVDFTKWSAALVFGQDKLGSTQVASCQSISGTGALRLAAEFGAKFMGKPIYLPHITWANHAPIFREAGFGPDKIKSYAYYQAATCSLDIAAFLKDLNAMEEGSMVLLHCCAHNPTGVDPSKAQWDEILTVVQARGLLPIFDSAYQGFATGDLEADAYSVRRAVAMGLECMVCQSFSKNMGLYGERCGALHTWCADEAAAKQVASQVALIVRPMYSNPPSHGAWLVWKILSDPALRAEWEGEVKGMADAIIGRRQMLFDALKANGAPGDWQHVLDQIGMFSFTGLTPEQSDAMVEKHHVYMLKNGRVSIAGLNSKTVAHVADAIKDVVVNAPKAASKL
jgi:aspartate aminotransferase